VLRKKDHNFSCPAKRGRPPKFKKKGRFLFARGSKEKGTAGRTEYDQGKGERGEGADSHYQKKRKM